MYGLWAVVIWRFTSELNSANPAQLHCLCDRDPGDDFPNKTLIPTFLKEQDQTYDSTRR
jgi:hypothetical protein